MKTKTIGELLKEERLKSRMKIEELSKRTRIRQEYLEALEDNRFEDLPAATFVKGYIKSYGALFGFDHRPMVGLLRRDYKESAKGKLVPREFIKPVLKKRTRSSITLVVIVLGVVFASLIGYVGVQWYQFQQPPDLVISSPEDKAFVASQVVIEGQTEPEAVVTVNAAPVALQPDGSFQTEVFLAREGTTTITIQSRDRRGKTRTEQRTVYVRF